MNLQRQHRSSGVRGHRVWAKASTVLLVLAGAIGLGAPAAAVDQATYYFLPGHPVYFDNGGTASGLYYGKCTGGYAIAGTDGTFITSAHCHVIYSSVRGEDRTFGRLAFVNGTTTLIREDPDDDALQIVVDPTSGLAPSDGRVVGYMSTSEQTLGTLVGKMGAGSGWTEGNIIGWIPWRDRQAICTDAEAARGDAGGPVWRWDAAGLRALGIVVAYDPETRGACYVPMQQILNDWGAWLPVFGPTAYATTAGRLDAGIPELDASDYIVPIEYVPTADLP